MRNPRNTTMNTSARSLVLLGEKTGGVAPSSPLVSPGCDVIAETLSVHRRSLPRHPQPNSSNSFALGATGPRCSARKRNHEQTVRAR